MVYNGVLLLIFDNAFADHAVTFSTYVAAIAASAANVRDDVVAPVFYCFCF